LGRDPAATRRKRLRLGAIATVVAGMAAGATLLARSGDDPCVGAAEELGGVLGEARRSEVRDAMLAVDTPYAAVAADGVAQALDGYAHDWIATRTEACTA